MHDVLSPGPVWVQESPEVLRDALLILASRELRVRGPALSMHASACLAGTVRGTS